MTTLRRAARPAVPRTPAPSSEVPQGSGLNRKRQAAAAGVALIAVTVGLTAALWSPGIPTIAGYRPDTAQRVALTGFPNARLGRTSYVTFTGVPVAISLADLSVGLRGNDMRPATIIQKADGVVSVTYDRDVGVAGLAILQSTLGGYAPHAGVSVIVLDTYSERIEVRSARTDRQWGVDLLAVTGNFQDLDTSVSFLAGDLRLEAAIRAGRPIPTDPAKIGEQMAQWRAKVVALAASPHVDLPSPAARPK